MKADYVRSDELQDEPVALADLPALFNVDKSTVRRWMAKDGIKTFPNPYDHPNDHPTLAVRWGDIPLNRHKTRWRRKQNAR